MSAVPRHVRDIVLGRAERHGWTPCEICGLQPGTNLHHRRARGAGGSRRRDTNTASNLLWVCGMGNTSGCHGRIETRRVAAYAEGWLVRQAAVPLEIPVLLWDRESGDRGYVVLDDIGGMTPAMLDLGGAA